VTRLTSFRRNERRECGRGRYRCALDERAAVGEEGEGVGAAAELEQQPVLADIAVGTEAVGSGGQVDGAMMFVDLDGVAAAESDMRSAFATKMGKVAQSADLAARARG